MIFRWPFNQSTNLCKSMIDLIPQHQENIKFHHNSINHHRKICHGDLCIGRIVCGFYHAPADHGHDLDLE